MSTGSGSSPQAGTAAGAISSIGGAAGGGGRVAGTGGQGGRTGDTSSLSSFVIGGTVVASGGIAGSRSTVGNASGGDAAGSTPRGGAASGGNASSPGESGDAGARSGGTAGQGTGGWVSGSGGTAGQGTGGWVSGSGGTGKDGTGYDGGVPDVAHAGGQGIRLEAEDYVAASDTTAGNSGNCYRAGEVDIESCAEGGFDVAWIEKDEWLEYDFEVTDADSFNLVARTATPFGSSRGLQLMLDGAAVSDWIDVPMTRAWQEWTDVRVANVSIRAGKHRLRANLGGNFNLDYFYVASATRPPLTAPNPGPGAPPTAPAQYRSPVSQHGPLRVAGTSLRDANNQPIQLRGFSTHGLQWFPMVAEHTIPRLAYEWGISWIRPAMYVEDIKNGGYWGGYLAQPGYMKEKVIECVEDALSAGIYVVIDWHIHNNPENFTESAVAYFKEMATRYGGYPNTIYEICNEPEYVDWAVIKRYASKVIPEIRKIDPDNVIIVGTPNWSQWVDVAAADRLPNDTNVMYALHFYAGAHKEENRKRAETALNLGLPLIASEWGTSDYTGGTNNITDLAESQIWLDWINARNISWTSWSFSNKGEASAALQPGVGLAGPWREADLTESGRYVKNALTKP